MNKITRVKIMVFGTFDILHKGHLNFFKQARKLSKNPYLIVSVARDANVKKIKKRKPAFSEKQRLVAVSKCQIVDKVVLGGLKNYLPHILKEKPQIIALGYDQEAYVANLERLLAQKGQKVRLARLKAYRKNTYKSSLVKLKKVSRQ